LVRSPDLPENSLKLVAWITAMLIGVAITPAFAQKVDASKVPEE
jgi:hypothetical protein